MDKSKELNLIAQQIRALSQTGLAYSTSEYDTERYTEMVKLSNRIVSLISGQEEEFIDSLYLPAKEYVTPKTDIRAVVFNANDEVLLVKEQFDGKWSLPGGWADVGFTPKEIAVKEVKEETGLDVEAIRLLAVMDMSRHSHPAIPFYVYKYFILCKITGGTFNEAFDIQDKGFFNLQELPPLSLERVVPEQITTMYEYYKNPDKEVYLD